jgi:hypothetical protein
VKKEEISISSFLENWEGMKMGSEGIKDRLL